MNKILYEKLELVMQDLYLAADLKKDNELEWDDLTYSAMADAINEVLNEIG